MIKKINKKSKKMLFGLLLGFSLLSPSKSAASDVDVSSWIKSNSGYEQIIHEEKLGDSLIYSVLNYEGEEKDLGEVVSILNSSPEQVSVEYKKDEFLANSMDEIRQFYENDKNKSFFSTNKIILQLKLKDGAKKIVLNKVFFFNTTTGLISDISFYMGNNNSSNLNYQASSSLDKNNNYTNNNFNYDVNSINNQINYPINNSTILNQNFQEINPQELKSFLDNGKVLYRGKIDGETFFLTRDENSKFKYSFILQDLKTGVLKLFNSSMKDVNIFLSRDMRIIVDFGNEQTLFFQTSTFSSGSLKGVFSNFSKIVVDEQYNKV